MATATPEKGQAVPEPKSRFVPSPVAIYDTPAAKAVSLGRPAVLIALLFLRFDALVRDPVSTLQTALPVVAAIQAVYAVVCVPVAGSSAVKAVKKPRPGEKKKPDAATPNQVVTVVLSLLLTAIVIPAVHVLFILFGAPFLDHVSHTFLCAAHFSLLGIFPIFYARGVDGQALTALAGAYAPFDETFGGLLGAVFGAWLGAVPIPLDWDREWQKWPVTIIAGLYLGHAVGSKLIGGLFYGKRIALADTKEE